MVESEREGCGGARELWQEGGTECFPCVCVQNDFSYLDCIPVMMEIAGCVVVVFIHSFLLIKYNLIKCCSLLLN